MKILVTGGAGYIGTHTCVELLKAGYEIAVIDNLCNSKKEAIRRVEEISGKTVPFYEADLRDKAEKSQVRLTVEGQDVQAEGVRRLLHETIYNLCDNAIGYNVPGGSVRVTVSDAGENAVISVADTGIGIAPEHQPRIFERFYRVDKSHSKASGGTGLGLSIVKHAVAYHHGTVQMESQPGKGTTITVTIPRKQS